MQLNKGDLTFISSGGGNTDLNNYYEKYEIYQLIASGTTGTIEVPKVGGGSIDPSKYTVQMDSYSGGVDALILKTSGGFPIDEISKDVDGINQFVILYGTGNRTYLIHNTCGSYPTALVYTVKMSLEASKELDFNYVLEREEDLSNLLPYDGATKDVDLDSHSITATQFILKGLDHDSNPISVPLNFDQANGVPQFQFPDGTNGQVFQELWFEIKATEDIANGDVCQFIDVQGDHILAKKAVQSEIEVNPYLIIGIATQNIAKYAYGKVTCFGKVNDVFTTGYALKDKLYFDSSGVTHGAMTNIAPVAPNRKILMAAVIKLATGASENGIIMVRPTFGLKLTDLDDVDGVDTTIASGSSLLFKLTTGIWKTITESNFITWLKGSLASLTGGNTFSGVQSMLDGVKVTKIYPNVDGIAAVKITKANDGGDIVIVDTSNGRIGIGVAPGTYGLNIIGNFKSSGTVTASNGLGELSGNYVTTYANLATQFGNVNTAANSALALISKNIEFLRGLPSQAISILTGKKLYRATSQTADTVNDTAQSNASGVEIFEKCTVANATKESGTWRKTQLIGAEKTLTNNVDTNVMDIFVATDTMQCVIIDYSIAAKDTTNHLVRSHVGYISVNVRNQNGVITSQILHPATMENDLGVITDTWTATTGTGKVTLSLTANASGMTPTAMLVYFDVKSHGTNNITLL